MPFGIVYGLYDPRTGCLRYVGQTTKPVLVRLSAHLAPSSLRQRYHVSKWLRQLVGLGLTPICNVLGEAESKDALDALEVEFIAECKAAGHELTNISPGGRQQSPQEAP